jgi:hypothetical protein
MSLALTMAREVAPTAPPSKAGVQAGALGLLPEMLCRRDQHLLVRAVVVVGVQNQLHRSMGLALRAALPVTLQAAQRV